MICAKSSEKESSWMALTVTPPKTFTCDKSEDTNMFPTSQTISSQSDDLRGSPLYHSSSECIDTVALSRHFESFEMEFTELAIEENNIF